MFFLTLTMDFKNVQSRFLFVMLCFCRLWEKQQKIDTYFENFGSRFECYKTGFSCWLFDCSGDRPLISVPITQIRLINTDITPKIFTHQTFNIPVAISRSEICKLVTKVTEISNEIVNIKFLEFFRLRDFIFMEVFYCWGVGGKLVGFWK